MLPAQVPPAEVPPEEEVLPPFAERIKRVLDAELAVIERTLKVLGPASNTEAERTTRILAALSRTVQEIQASAEGQAGDEADDDTVPSDIDEFRETLARRIRGFIEARTGSASRRHGGSAGDIERGGT